MYAQCLFRKLCFWYVGFLFNQHCISWYLRSAQFSITCLHSNKWFEPTPIVEFHLSWILIGDTKASLRLCLPYSDLQLIKYLFLDLIQLWNRSSSLKLWKHLQVAFFQRWDLPRFYGFLFFNQTCRVETFVERDEINFYLSLCILAFFLQNIKKNTCLIIVHDGVCPIDGSLRL